MTDKSLCDSCTNIGCEFQSGIVRTKCAFYMPPQLEPDNCGNYVVQDSTTKNNIRDNRVKNELNRVKDELEPITKNCESCRYYGSHHEVCNYCYKCSLWTEQEPTTKNDLGVDCIDRVELLKAMNTYDKFGNDSNERLVFLSTPALQDRYVPYVHYDEMVNCVKGMPTVTPQESILDKIRAEIDKERFIDKDTRIVKNALASGLEVAMQIIDKYANDRCDKGCDFCEHTSECMPSKEEEGAGMTREEAIEAIKANYPSGGYHQLCEALDIAIKTLEDFEALNAINLDFASENEDLVERIGKLIGYIDFLRNTAQGKKKSLNLLEKVVKGKLEEIRAEGENFVKPRTGEWIPVTERLPEEGQMVIACYPTDCGKRVMTAYYYKECGFSCGITYAWMPLPQPYKAESEGE